MVSRNLIRFASLLLLTGCLTGPEGPTGEQGIPGLAGAACWDLNANGQADLDSEDLNADGVVDVYDCQGPEGDGEDGEDGEDWAPADFVGVDTCAMCHPDAYESWRRSGHAGALLATDGAEPSEPWDGLGSFGAYAAEPPSGYTWGDIAYTLGGWGWKQAFVDADGYVITGDETAWATDGDAWIPFEEAAAPGSLEMDCAACHATGYTPSGHQGDLAGVQGTWLYAGVQCEACHGPGSQHADEPYLVHPEIDRAAEACGSCHTRGDAEDLPAADGFFRDQGQWNELFHSKKHVMDCVDCHQPHQSAHYADATYDPDQGIRVECATCHWEQAAHQKESVMETYVGCVGCHMPLATHAAWDENALTADMRTHLFSINPAPDAEQFSSDGSTANPWIGLELACKGCHGEGDWMPYSDEELVDFAEGYHD